MSELEHQLKAIKETNVELLEERDYYKGLVDYVKSEDSRIRQERDAALREAREATTKSKKLEEEKRVLLHFLVLKHEPDVETVIQEAIGHFLSGDESVSWKSVMDEVSKIYLRKLSDQAQELHLY